MKWDESRRLDWSMLNMKLYVSQPYRYILVYDDEGEVWELYTLYALSSQDGTYGGGYETLEEGMKAAEIVYAAACYGVDRVTHNSNVTGE